MHLISSFFCLLILYEVAGQESAKVISNVGKDLECVTGLMYQENKCNFCLCTLGRLILCTGRSCFGDDVYDGHKNCLINSEWKEKCNICMCVKKLGTLCTIHPCSPFDILEEILKFRT